MDYKLIDIRLDKLNIPADNLRKKYTPAATKRLKESIEKNGIIVPIIVRELGRGEYDIWDGSRRIKTLNELGTKGTYLIPAKVVKGDDAQGIINQLNINQVRENLTDLSEAEGLKKLVSDYKYKQKDAAKLLLKSKSWASQIMSVWSLPKEILKNLRKGNIPLNHAVVLARYKDKPQIMKLLYEIALKGNIAHPQLSAIGMKAEKEGIKEARKWKPKRLSIGKKSWVRIMPLRTGFKAEIHINNEDDKKAAGREIMKILTDL